MSKTLKSYTTLIDFITGREIPNIGPEENRQAVEHYLVEQKGYAMEDIEVDAEISLDIRGEAYRSVLHLVVQVDRKRCMVIMCAAGSLGSWERQTIAAARLLDAYPIPLAVVSDGKTALVTDCITGGKIGENLSAIPCKAEARRRLQSVRLESLPPERRQREMLIFRTYDRERVNVQRNMT